MRRSSLLLPAIFMAMVVFSSCQKDGSEGPAGPAGPAGGQGPQGPQGPEGTANVIYSDWIDVAFEEVLDEDDQDNDDDVTEVIGYIAGIEAEKIDNAILSTGEIKVYLNWSTADDPVVSPLPYFDGGLLLNLDFVTGGIIVTANADFSSTVNNDDEKILQFRYVLIPGSVLALKPAGVNLNNYSEAKQYLKLKN